MIHRRFDVIHVMMDALLGSKSVLLFCCRRLRRWFFNISLNDGARFHLHTSVISEPLGGWNDHTGTRVPPQMRSFVLRFTSSSLSSSSSFSSSCWIGPAENLPSALKTQQ